MFESTYYRGVVARLLIDFLSVIRVTYLYLKKRPQELDEAARRRLVKRLYIPLPDGPARKMIVTNLMNTQSHTLSEEDLDKIVTLTEGTDMAWS